MRGRSPRRRRGALLVVLALALAAGGCGKTRLDIQSDTCWDGWVNQTINVHGCGNKSYDITSGFKCAEVSKTTPNGYLRVRIKKRAVWVETTDPYGTVRVCD